MKTETRKKKSKKKKKVPEKLVLRRSHMFFRNVPVEIRNRWRAFCKKRDVTMRDRLVELMLHDVNNDIRSDGGTKRIRRPRHQEEE